jgi:hypothetical protein
MILNQKISDPVFIIAHKYYRGYQSYLKHYIDNIFKFYTDPLVVIVDNNSLYKEDVFETIDKNKNIIFLDNNIECKFEIGAYQVGIKYLIDNKLANKYDYIVFTQDNFIIKNKLDFNILAQRQIKACTINSYYQDGDCAEVCEKVLKNLGLYNNLNRVTFCWCNSFIASKDRLANIYDYFKKIIIKIRWESCASERYLARILWELNDQKNFDIDGDIRALSAKYDCWTVDPFSDAKTFFVKKVQQKNETTIDK